MSDKKANVLANSITQSLIKKTADDLEEYDHNDITISTTQQKPKEEQDWNESGWKLYASPDQRYEPREELGRGALGQVIKVYDRNIGREVARKTLLKGVPAPEKETSRFVEEICLTGQLEHPNVIPVYDLGTLSDGQLFYTMRMISSHNLAEAMEKRELSLFQFVKILQQVCMGLEYAHSRQVIHRDIKPHNILLGEFGEVLIVDWGVAEAVNPAAVNMEHLPTLHELPRTMRGTPLYMAPELVKEGKVSPALDQYALGVMLYLFLTDKYPFFEENIYTLFFQITTLSPIPPSQRTPERPIPEEIERICLRMLAQNPADRYSSCRVVHDQLEEFLEGTKERERRQREAQGRIHEAKQYIQELHQQKHLIATLQKSWEEANKAVAPWESEEKKLFVWEKEEAHKQAQQNEIKLFSTAEQKYVQALEHEPRNSEARRGLADLYWEKFLEAEKKYNELDQIYYHERVLFFDDGFYATVLFAECQLHLQTQPEEAEIQVYQYVEKNRRLVPEWLKYGGITPTHLSLPPGSYLIRLQKKGFREVAYPVLLQRGDQRTECVNLYTEKEIGPDYVYVPGGTFAFGGDIEARLALPFEMKHEDDFFISRYPITLGEYLQFLNEIYQQDPILAQEMVPQSASEEVYAVLHQGQYIPHRESLFHGAIAERYREGTGAEEKLPVMGISWYHSLLYSRWRSQKEGRFLTLPTEAQWEKSAAGADRRVYPWGNQFDATFCKMGLSRDPKKEFQPEPVGTFPQDESPYGVCDMVGTISEWTLPITPQEANQLQHDPKLTPIQRGGGWTASQSHLLHIQSRTPRSDGVGSYNCGLRLVALPVPRGKPK